MPAQSPNRTEFTINKVGFVVMPAIDPDKPRSHYRIAMKLGKELGVVWRSEGASVYSAKLYNEPNGPEGKTLSINFADPRKMAEALAAQFIALNPDGSKSQYSKWLVYHPRKAITGHSRRDDD